MVDGREKLCFLICPIGEEDSEIRSKSDSVFKNIVDYALKSKGYHIERADKITKSGKISTQIVDKILRAELVIADLTGGNPNVFYELAIRHAIKKPFIHIAEEGTKIPFDLIDMRTIFYKLDDATKLLEAIELLKDYSNEIDNDDKITFNSPITETIQFSRIKESGTEQEKLLVNIIQTIENLDSKISRSFDYFNKILNNFEMNNQNKLIKSNIQNVLMDDDPYKKSIYSSLMNEFDDLGRNIQTLTDLSNKISKKDSQKYLEQINSYESRQKEIIDQIKKLK